MTLLGRLLQFRAPEPEQRSRFFDAVNQVGQAFGLRGQCTRCGRPLADHADRFGQFHSCVERPVGRAA